MAGTLVLDIDGTLTDHTLQIPQEVADHLKMRYNQGWRIMLITGRSYTLALHGISRLDFPFLLSVHNGSDLISMPEGIHLHEQYMPPSVVSHLDELFLNLPEDILIYSGYKTGDHCFFRPERFSDKGREFMGRMQSAGKHPWAPVPHFAFEEGRAFPMVKCIGTEDEMHYVGEQLAKEGETQWAVITDPVEKFHSFLLVTDKQVSKKHALEKALEDERVKGPLFVAGDDRNDAGMIALGDYKVVMNTAPEEMHSIADILAPPSTEFGIITALNQALS